MSGATIGSLKSLPVETHPRFAVSVCIETLVICLSRTERALSPPIWKKFLGGVSRDHARAVAAACKADARKIRTTIKDVIYSLAVRSASGKERNSGLRGYCERLLALVDEWRDCATRFEENEFLADQKLLELTRTLMTICAAMKGTQIESLSAA